ncbi:MAG: hypothetical protein H6633_25805 [Anaerolineales bacterium]|nr:hypothetical protein [Anaerolineales bacterium]
MLQSRIVTVVSFIALVVVILAMLIAAPTVIQAVALVATPTAVVVSILICLTIGGLGAALFWGFFQAAEKKRIEKEVVRADVRQKNANALKTEAEAQLIARQAAFEPIIAPAGHQVIGVHFGSMTSTAKQYHLSPHSHVNGLPANPTPFQLAIWEKYNTLYAPGRAAQGSAPAPALTAGKLPERVDLLDLLPSGQGNLERIILGVKTNNTQVDTITAPIWSLVHIANAGATDSGKSNMARAIAYQIVTAPQARAVFVDLKRQTFKAFRHCDSLLYPLVTSIPEFMAILAELKDETERRLSLFEPYLTVETIHDYNRRVDEPLPYIVTFVDEISNIFMDKDAQARFLELIRISRAAGIYFCCAGQTWSHRTLSTDIRQQFRTGLHFGTNDPNSSRMILNDPRACEIDHQGRCYAALPFGIEREVVEMQTPYLPLEIVVNRLGQGGGPAEQMPEPVAPEPGPNELKVLRLKQQDFSISAIARDIYGDDGATS